MLNVSNKFKEVTAEGSAEFLAYVDTSLVDGTVLNLTDADIWDNGLEIEDAVSSDNTFDIGAAIINKASITLNNISEKFSNYVFDGAEVSVQIGLETSEGVIERIRKGVFAVDETKYNGSLIKLECLDNMRKFDRPYSESTLQYPASLNAIVRDACTVCGVVLQTTTFPHDDYVVQTRPTDEAVTFREVISWVAQIACRFCRCDVYGRLELKWYNQTALENPDANQDSIHTIKSIHTIDTSMDDVVITGVRVVEKTDNESTEEEFKSYQSGSDGYVISIENNPFITKGMGRTVVGWLGEQLIGMRFRKASVSHIKNPTIEAGDVAVIEDNGKKYNIVVSSTRFSIDGKQNTQCSAETPERNSATRYSAETKNYVEWRKALKKEKTEREKALDELAKRLSNSSGAYTTIEVQEGGGNVYYLHNKPNLSDSDMVWKMTTEAWGVSTDGGKTWNGGMTVDGDTIVRILTATGVNADWLNAGAITVRDDKGNIIFSVDMDTKQVIISGDSVRIGGLTATRAISNATDTADEALREAQKARNLNIILDNEYQGIPCDYQGNVTVFPEVKTTVQAFYGQTDVSASCTYTVQKSDGITGTWDNGTRTYTVTALTADTGWVDITASYLNIFTTTKRFNVAKVKDGRQGEKGDTGDPGKDAIALVIESSGGFIFKNSAIATTLTAKVYKGGVEMTGSNLNALGTIKWYKDGGATAVGTGTTLTISAGDVSNSASYTAQLEG